MKILIIGSEGFIGKHVVDYYLKKKLLVFGVDLKEVPHCDYNYKKILPQTLIYESLFSDIKPDVCLFASGSASIPLSIQDPVSDLEANFLQVARILNMIRLFSPETKFINISSAAVYGNPNNLPISENSGINPLSPYGWHKYYSELICKEYTSLYTIKTCSVRPFSVYGSGQNKLLFWDIYQKTLKNKNIELFGSGNETRDFIYIDDFVAAIDIIINKAPLQAETYNIGSGTETSITAVATLFAKVLNFNGTIHFNNIRKAGDPLKWLADINLIKQLGFEKSIDLHSGLKLYAQWLKENE